jgi:hypothetical protein
VSVNVSINSYLGQIADPNAAYQAEVRQLVADHQRGLHPYGSMRRDCPLCAERGLYPRSRP